MAISLHRPVILFLRIAERGAVAVLRVDPFAIIDQSGPGSGEAVSPIFMSGFIVLEMLARMSPDACLSLCCRIALVGVAISSAELLAIRREFGTCGVFNWRILRTCYFESEVPLAARAGPRLGVYAAVVAILAVRFSASAFYIVLPNSQLAPAALALAVAGTLYIHFRCVYGLDGSDQMGLIVTMTGLLAALPATLPRRPWGSGSSLANPAWPTPRPGSQS